jgi:tetratricopeptide (TPR) repeat protein
VVIYYAGLSAKKAGKYDKAIEYLKMAQKLNYGKTDKDKILVYKLLAETYKENKDTAKYISTLKKGIEKYPSVSSLLIPDVINFYLAKKQNDEALNYLNKAIQQDPKNPTYYYARGNLYELTLGKLDSAEADYKKAIELKEDYFDAIYSLGAMYYNRGVDILKKADNEQDNTKYEKMKKEAMDMFKKALPHLEKAHEMNPDDLNPMISLKAIYYRLGQLDKYEKIKKELDAKRKQ